MGRERAMSRGVISRHGLMALRVRGVRSECRLIFADSLSGEMEWVGNCIKLDSHSKIAADDVAQVLSVFRKLAAQILGVRLDVRACDVCLMAYDLGVSEGLYGVRSAVSRGLRLSLRDARRFLVAELSDREVAESSRLGRRHGQLVRQFMSHRNLG